LDDTTVVVEVGRHDLERIARSAVVITSPGVPPDASPLDLARKAGVEILAELDLAAMMLPDSRLIVVTGTNGKTTTTALIAHVLQKAGQNAVAAGNIGIPLIDVAAKPIHPDWVAVEASSFQLHDSPHLGPTIGVLTNLAPDHLDRYTSQQDYYADKRNLFRNASHSSIWILNADDSAVQDLADKVPGTRYQWSLDTECHGWYDRTSGLLMLLGQPLLNRSELSLLGDHNVSNALAAALAVAAADVVANDIAEGLSSFPPLRHRLEPVGEVAGVLWINDSKATNISSALVAVLAMERQFVLIAGGRPKGGDYSALGQLLVPKCRSVVVYGEAGETIASALQTLLPVHQVGPFEDAVAQAQDMAQPGDAVLLSPACASFDQFSSYEERGDRFCSLVEAM
jgi:UDP-N-acetylmuramoylalanine--D-glutamate ligase